MAEEAASLWQETTGKPGAGTPLSAMSTSEANGVTKEIGDAVDWFRKFGQFMDLSEAIAEEGMFKKAESLAQFWGDYAVKMDPGRAGRASKELEDLLEWNRNTKKKHKGLEPEKVERLNKALGIWEPKEEPSVNNKKIAKELEDALGWW